MRKLIIILTLFILILTCGCAKSKNEGEIAPEAVVKMPTDNTVNGYRIIEPSYGTESSQSSDVNDVLLYYANKNTKTFHLNTCGSAKRIKNENLYITDDRAELLLDDYKPCSNCKP